MLCLRPAPRPPFLLLLCKSQPLPPHRVPPQRSEQLLSDRLHLPNRRGAAQSALHSPSAQHPQDPPACPTPAHNRRGPESTASPSRSSLPIPVSAQRY